MPDLVQTCRRFGIAAVVSSAFLLVAVPSAMAGLTPFYSASGAVSLSQNGYASNSNPITNPIVKPSAGATVRAAFLFAAATPFVPIPDSGSITLDGTPITFTDTAVTSSFGNQTREADVTSIVKPIIDAAPAGNVNQTITEDPSITDGLDGEILAVVFNDPSVANNSIALLYGTQNTNGDTFHVAFAQPIDLSTQSIQFALGISFSFENFGSDQYSLVDLNGTPPDPSNPTAGPDPARLTTSAGGEDDATPPCDEDGCLLTVGGVGDSPTNPTDPFALPSDCTMPMAWRCDDELYTLGAPYVKNGDTSLSVYTLNPSANDDVLYSSFVFKGLAAVVGEGITLAPPSQTHNTGDTATVNAHVQDDNGNPISGRAVTFKVTAGPNAGKTGTATTNASGNASFSYTSTATGTDTVEASFVDDSGNTKTSNDVTVTWTASSTDTTPPTCKILSIIRTPTMQQEKVTVQDTGSGLASIFGISVTNGTVSVPAFTSGTTSPVVVTANKTDLSKTTKWSFHAKDVAGNSTFCN
jgi:Bacterial Ig-like domain (group 1)